MNKQASIKYISGLMAQPDSLTDGDQSSIAGLRQSFPYFVPVRYMEARRKHNAAPFDPVMLSAVTPYLGDWVLFCQFAGQNAIGSRDEESPGAAPATDSIDIVEVALEIPGGEVDEVASEQLIDNEIVVNDATEADPDELHKNFWVQEGTGDDDDIAEAVAATVEVAGDINEEQDEDESEATGVTAEPVAGDAGPEKTLISPVYTDDYFLQQGEKISPEMPAEIDSLIFEDTEEGKAKSLMVMMSFSEWLLHFKNTTEKQKEESKDQRALKTMWQKEKLAAAMEEENEEIPENVFEMAVNSIAKEDGLASEPLAEIYIKQGKADKAIDMYRKLSLRNPQKSAYFALKIEEILKEKQS